MKNILMIVGHPYWEDSVANKTIVEEFLRLNPQAIVSNLSEIYPDGKIDVDAEHGKLVEADTIVFQFPIMWYSCPSIMHRWMEEVLSFGFAYGPNGDSLRGKTLIASFTTGTSADKYSRYGSQKMTIDELMPPFAGIANLCGMKWGGYILTDGMVIAGNTDTKQLALFKARAEIHAHRLSVLIDKIG